MKKTANAAAANPHAPPKCRIAQPNGNAAKDPNVPGATGDFPAPNHVPKTKAAFVLTVMVVFSF